MASIRPPAVAGAFYPSDPAELRSMVDGFLAEAQSDQPVAVADSSVASGRTAPKALIVPHAGYVYSGSVAASAYLRLAPLRGTIARVVLLGPSHRIGFRGLALCSADYFDTPLGRIPLDQTAQQALAGLPYWTPRTHSSTAWKCNCPSSSKCLECFDSCHWSSGKRVRRKYPKCSSGCGAAPRP
jgi:AmmeMemoRadiSam system protein B